MNELAIVILAAGKGKRMNNPEIPKVLAPINKRPLIYYVLNQVNMINPQNIVVVVGHKGELVKQYIKDTFPNQIINFVYQEQQLGTGHAVQVAYGILENFGGNTLILAGDVPNLNFHTILQFINQHNNNNADISVLSAIADNPFGYGRIVRNNNGDFIKITEQKDANQDELNINEINSGIILANNKILFKLLSQINNSNNQNEYYLTDIIEKAVEHQYKVYASSLANFSEIQGVNTSDELIKVENYMKNKGE